MTSRSEFPPPSTDRQTQEQDPRFEKLTPDKRCLCRECGHFFASASAFDQHRVRRQCDAPGQRGLIQRPDGFWYSHTGEQVKARKTPFAGGVA